MHDEAARAAAIQFGIRCGYDTTAPAWETSRFYHVNGLLTHGVERLQELVVSHVVGLEAADRYARHKSPEEQNNATIADIRKYYNETRSRRSRRLRPEGERTKSESIKAKRASWRRQRHEAAINAALRLAAKPKVTDEEFERPPPELMDQQYPGREPGVTYAHVHREQHGPIWHNVARRKQLNLARKLKELAAELEKAVDDASILDAEQMASVQKRWRIAMNRLRAKLYCREGDEADEEDDQPSASMSGLS
jgi:hypothetical protein